MLTCLWIKNSITTTAPAHKSSCSQVGSGRFQSTCTYSPANWNRSRIAWEGTQRQSACSATEKPLTWIRPRGTPVSRDQGHVHAYTRAYVWLCFNACVYIYPVSWKHITILLWMKLLLLLAHLIWKYIDMNWIWRKLHKKGKKHSRTTQIQFSTAKRSLSHHHSFWSHLLTRLTLDWCWKFPLKTCLEE